MFDYDLISIGSGSTGRTSAIKLKRAGWKVALVEKNVDESFGGTCINRGCIPTKALIAESNSGTSFQDVYEHKVKIVNKIHDGTVKHVHERVGVDIIEGEAKFIDTNTIEVDGKKYTSDLFVIGTGSKPAIPPINGLSELDYRTSDDILELTSTPKKVLTIGGGRIGLELSIMLHNLGSEVIIFEGTDQIIPGEDNEVAKDIEKYLIDQGIQIIKGRFVDEVSKLDDGQYRVSLLDGPQKGNFVGDCLFIATGRSPNSEKLGLENIGVKTDRERILVNEFLQTSVETIFAGGDVIGNPMFTNWAHFHGSFIANNLQKSKTEKSLWERLPNKAIPRVTFIEPELASVGLTEEDARKKYGDKVITYKFYNRWLGKSLILNQTVGYIKGIGLENSNEILGVSFWGYRSGSLIQLVILAMDNGLGWQELREMIYGHPVLSESISGLASGMNNQTNI